MPEAKAFRSELATSADRDLQEIPIQAQRKILSEIQLRLKAEPFRETKTRIERLTGTVPPVCRLGIVVYRTYYRIVDGRVIVLAILHKKDNERWLGRFFITGAVACNSELTACASSANRPAEQESGTTREIEGSKQFTIYPLTAKA